MCEDKECIPEDVIAFMLSIGFMKLGVNRYQFGKTVLYLTRHLELSEEHQRWFWAKYTDGPRRSLTEENWDLTQAPVEGYVYLADHDDYWEAIRGIVERTTHRKCQGGLLQIHSRIDVVSMNVVYSVQFHKTTDIAVDERLAAMFEEYNLTGAKDIKEIMLDYAEDLL